MVCSEQEKWSQAEWGKTRHIFSLSALKIRLAQNNPSCLCAEKGQLDPASVVLFLICQW